MSYRREYLELGDDELVAQCRVHVYKSSGPGGQHRNKVSSAVRLQHAPTGLTAHGDESRSQQDNRQMALKRLRMNLACRLRLPMDAGSAVVHPVVRHCMFRPRGRGSEAHLRLEVGRRDQRFWTIAAVLLDALEANEGRLAPTAGLIGITTGNLASLLRTDRHLFAAAQAIRRRYNRHPLN